MENKESFRRPNLFALIRKWFSYFLLQYELITCTCMFEPWEKVFINGLVFIIFSLIAYSSWVYLPPYLLSLYAYLTRFTGTHVHDYSQISPEL